MEEQIQALMKLGCTYEEALQTLADDKDIDRGKKKDFDLTPEQQKVAKQYTKTGTRKTSYNFTKRERKENTTKTAIIQALYNFLLENADLGISQTEISNKERQIKFSINEDNFELTLVQKRKPKAS